MLKSLRSRLCQCDHVDFLRYLVLAFVAVSLLRLPKAQHRPGRIGDDAERACALYLDLVLDDGRAERLGLRGGGLKVIDIHISNPHRPRVRHGVLHKPAAVPSPTLIMV